MKHYLILTRNISNLGGGQLYTLRRAKYLLGMGYNVTVIDHFEENNFILKDEFSGCNIIHIPQLIKPIAYYSPNKSESIINYIINTLNICDSSIYIETHSFYLGVWGEKLAIKLRAKHLIYCYEEWKLIKNYKIKPGKNFLVRKYLNNEFFGCSSQSIRILFGNIFNFNNYINIPFDKTEIKDHTVPTLDLKPSNEYFTITTISRLEKTYIDNLIEDVSIFAQTHPNQKIRLIICGDSKNKQRLHLIKNKCHLICKKSNNLEITFTGYVSILGKDLFQATNVFVGMGTASINAISQGVITINIDPLNKNLSSGFFGIDTKTAAFSDSNQSFSIIEKIEEVYNMSDIELKHYRMISEKLFNSNFSVETIFPKLDEVINSISPAKPNKDLIYSYSYYVFISTILNIRKICGNLLRKSGLKK